MSTARHHGHEAKSARTLPTPASFAALLRSTFRANTSMEKAGSLQDFAGKPLVVLTAGIGNEAKHEASQNELANLPTNSVHKTIDFASHEALVV